VLEAGGAFLVAELQRNLARLDAFQVERDRCVWVLVVKLRADVIGDKAVLVVAGVR
jgi:hypothetical protein